MRLQSKNLNQVRVINLFYIEIILQAVFRIWFLYPGLFWAGNNIHAWVYSIQFCSGLFNSIGNQLTIDSYMIYHAMQLKVTFMYWGISYLWMKKHLYVPSVSLIPWNRRPISVDMDLVHFGLSSPFIRRMYYWDFTVYGQITTFIFPVCIVTSPVVFFVSCSSP